jgi:large subunit ribosomal protein L25
MKSVSLKVYPRKATGRIALRPLRNQGRIPAVIYGAGQPSQSLEVDSKELTTVLQQHVSETLLVDLNVDSDARPQRLALVQEVQHHPLSREVVHVDFHEVSADEPVVVSVPVESEGEALGVKTGGGVLEHVMHKIKIRALPRDLPEAIVVDVTELAVGRSIHVSDVKVPEGVEILASEELVVLACAEPRTEAEAEVAETVEAAPTGEPEVIKEKKDDDGQEGAAAKEGEKKG